MPFFPSATHFSFIVIFFITDELVVVCSAFVDIWPFVVCCVIKRMASASSSSAKLLYGDSKARINQRVRYTIDGIGSLSRNLIRSSKSSETLMQSAKLTSQQEHILEAADLVSPHIVICNNTTLFEL
jgi:hypothetical protein